MILKNQEEGETLMGSYTKAATPAYLIFQGHEFVHQKTIKSGTHFDKKHGVKVAWGEWIMG